MRIMAYEVSVDKITFNDMILFLQKQLHKFYRLTMKMASMAMGIDPPPAAAGIDYLSHLPLEIHLLILQNLDYVDFTRFSAVCKAWRSIASAARQSPLFRLQQVPWLIYGRELRKLFSLHDSSCSICGYSQHWLLLREPPTLFKNGSSFLLNPITSQRISLPANPKSAYLGLHLGVILPHQSADGMEVIAYFLHDSLYHWRSQDEHWTKISAHSGGTSLISDMIYHKGNIYAIKNGRYIRAYIINMSLERPDSCLIRALWHLVGGNRFSPRFIHLVECNGDLMVVVIREGTIKVSVFKYNPIMDGWEEVKSIGKMHALLVDKGNSMAIDVSTNTRFRANCVYFLDYDSGQEIRCFELQRTDSRPSCLIT